MAVDQMPPVGAAAGAKMAGINDGDGDPGDSSGSSAPADSNGPGHIPKDDPMPDMPTKALGIITQAFLVVLANRLHPSTVSKDMLAKAAQTVVGMKQVMPGQSPSQPDQMAGAAPQGPPMQGPPQ